MIIAFACFCDKNKEKKYRKVLQRYFYDSKILMANTKTGCFSESSEKVPNEHWDFSAYKILLNFCSHYDENVVLLNETVFTKHNYRLIFGSILKHSRNISDLNEPYMLGIFEEYKGILLENPDQKNRFYLQSHFLFMNKYAVDVVSSHLNLSIELVGRVGFSKFFSNINPKLRLYCWVRSGVYPFYMSWARSDKFDKGRDVCFGKAFNIYLEHSISSSVYQAGCLDSITHGVLDDVRYRICNKIKWPLF